MRRTVAASVTPPAGYLQNCRGANHRPACTGRHERSDADFKSTRSHHAPASFRRRRARPEQQPRGRSERGKYGAGSPCIDRFIAEFVAQGSASAVDVSCVEQIHLPPFVTQVQVDQARQKATSKDQ
jgi:hypothetical protein